MYYHYSFIFQIGRNYHRVRVYKEYSKDQGLLGEPLYVVISPRMTDIAKTLRTIDTPKEVIKSIKGHTDRYPHVIWNEKGECLEASLKWSNEQWMEKYGETKRTSGWKDGVYGPYEYQRMSQRGTNVKNECYSITGMGLEKFTEKEVKFAENHYMGSIGKLATRLNSLGITDDSNFKVESGRVGQNFECYIKHEKGITKAWTIIAEGPIQRPHYRYLVK